MNNTRLQFLGVLAVIAILFASSSATGAGKAAQRSDPSIEHYGVGVTPAVYLVNFMVMYIGSPDDAAKMPAYRAPVPSSLSECLHHTATGCPYSEFATSFDDQPFEGKAKKAKNCSFPNACTTSIQLERLAPSVVERSEQINEPLGMERANRIARELGIEKSMIMTDEQWECTKGVPPWPENADKKIINACLSNLSNSNGNTNIPLSSYGLAITRGDFERGEDGPVLQGGGDVQSLCAPQAPCLLFNGLFNPEDSDGLRSIAKSCGWEPKLDMLWALQSFREVIFAGSACQDSVGAGTSECLVESVCP